MKSFYTFSFALILTSLFSNKIQAQKISDKGDRYFDQNQFDMAIKCYQQDIKTGNRKTVEYAMNKLADCYRITGEFEQAEITYKKILKRKKKDPKNYLNYGLSLKNSAKYAEAKVQFEEYIKLKPEDLMGPVYLISCDSAQIWLDETIGKEVKNLERINTENSEFSPVLLQNNKLFFSSSREGSTKALISFDGGGDLHRLDLYSIGIAQLETQQIEKKAIVNFKGINTPSHEGPATFSYDGSEVYFTRTVKGKRDKQTNQILGTLQVFYSKCDTLGHWSLPISAFSFNSKNYSVGHPSLSKAGDTIYYMSDKPGGKGKTDIYYSVKITDNIWGPPINAGNSVNTFGYEMFPFISEAGNLFFSSDAHPGMGQMDIFTATQIDGIWTNVHNLKPPLNSIANDFGISLDAGNMRGVFSSDRFNGKGLEDIYSFSDDLPLQLNVSNEQLQFDDKSIFDDLKYKIQFEGDTVPENLIANNCHYTIDLTKAATFTITVTKNGMPYNTLNFTFKRDSSENTSHLDVKAASHAFKLNACLYPPKNINDEQTQNCLVSVFNFEVSDQTNPYTFEFKDTYNIITPNTLQAEIIVKE